MNGFKHLAAAARAALLAFLIVLPILDLRLSPDAGSPSGLQLQAGYRQALTVAVLVFGLQLLAPLWRWRPRLPRPQLARRLEARRGWVLGLLIGLALLLPFYAGRGALSVATLALIYVLLGLSLNIVVGYAGLLNLGHVAFYAIGAYGYALLQKYAGLGFWLSLPLAGLLAAGAGVLLAFPILRLRGDYLAIVTLAFGEIIRLLLINLTRWTGGPTGINNIPAPTLFNLAFAKKAPAGMTPFHEWAGVAFSSEHRLMFNYFIILALCLLTLWVVNRLLRMPIGRAWEALREDEIACRSLGINPALVKVSAFGLGALFAGLAGAFFAARQGSISPNNFEFMESAIILAIVVLGGMGSQVGVILAAIAITVLPELAREFADYRMLLFGAVMVLMMIWRPQGLIPAVRPRVELGK